VGTQSTRAPTVGTLQSTNSGGGGGGGVDILVLVGSLVGTAIVCFIFGAVLFARQKRESKEAAMSAFENPMYDSGVAAEISGSLENEAAYGTPSTVADHAEGVKTNPTFNTHSTKAGRSGAQNNPTYETGAGYLVVGGAEDSENSRGPADSMAVRGADGSAYGTPVDLSSVAVTSVDLRHYDKPIEFVAPQNGGRHAVITNLTSYDEPLAVGLRDTEHGETRKTAKASLDDRNEMSL